MADFVTTLRRLSERGDPVGAEELIERIEAGLAGDPLVVVSTRREGKKMTKTQQPTPTKPPGRMKGPIWGLAAFVAAIAVAILYVAFSGSGGEEVADTQPPTTTAAPDAGASTDLEVIQQGVNAVYSGDGDLAAQLFELSDLTDDQVRQQAAYQAAIGGRLNLNCTETDSSGVFSCRTPYSNVLSDAIGHVDPGDTNDVVVENGVITEFAFPEHSFIVFQIGAFLSTQGRFEGYEHCDFGPFPEECATIQSENLDEWLDWRQTVQPVDVVEAALGAWYGGRCEEAAFLVAASFQNESGCGSDGELTEITGPDYESILGADVTLENCQVLESTRADDEGLTCDVLYSNAMNRAVGKSPAVTSRGFNVYKDAIVGSATGELAWYEEDYPEDTELRASFQSFAEEGDLAASFASAGCATERTSECAHLVMDNLDTWAAWYEGNR